MKVSVIIPAYNCQKYIRQTLDMVRYQSLPMSDIQIVVVLDGCTDSTPDIVREYARTNKDINIKIIESKTNHGASAARNAGIKQASGQFVHFLDSDDVINTDFYQRLYDAAVDTDADIAVCSFIDESSPQNSIVFDNDCVLSIPQDKLDMTRVDLHGYSVRYLIRKEFWKKSNLQFPQNLRYCEDCLVMTQMVCKSNRIVIVPESVYLYKYRANSSLTSAYTKKLQGICYHIARESVAQFLKDSGLRANTEAEIKTRIKLLDFIPLLTIRKYRNALRVSIKLFGFIPIMNFRTNKSN